MSLVRLFTRSDIRKAALLKVFRRAGWRAWLALGVALVAALWVWDSTVRQFQAQDDRPPASAPARPDVPPAQLSASEILDRSWAAWDAVQDYACQATSINRLSGVINENVLSVHFKRPGMFKHVIVGGPNKGVTITRNGEGKIIARPGGALGILVVTMQPEDSRLHDGRGIPFYRTDWGSELARLRDMRDRGASLERLTDEMDPFGRYWRIRMAQGDEVDEVWFDTATSLPRRFVSTRSGEFQRDARYDDIAINTSPEDAIFTIE